MIGVMAELVTSVASLCPEVEPARVEAMWGRLDQEYRRRFEREETAEHVRRLCRLSMENPVEVMIEPPDEKGGRIVCTVLAFDGPFVFSSITGTMAGTGFTIDEGDVYTLPAVRSGNTTPGSPALRRRFGPRRTVAKAPSRDPHRSGVIIDQFGGRLIESAGAYEEWASRFEAALREVLTLLMAGDEASRDAARRRVNELVTSRLAASVERRPDAVMQPLEMDLVPLEEGGEAGVRLTIVGQDTPAFLYTLSTALSLRGLDLRRVRIRQEGEGGGGGGGGGERVRDTLDLADPRGRPLDGRTLERIRLSVLLTKQFTYFLGSAPDPFTALQRFERMAQDLLQEGDAGEDLAKQLGDPRAMRDLARLLGASDYLWEDFIRGQYEQLLPILEPHLDQRRFSDPVETLPLRLERALGGAVGLAEQQDRVNRFKDAELYRIDLDHILTPGVDFRELSRRLTALAEVLIDKAAELVYADLVRSYGPPAFKGSKRETHLTRHSPLVTRHAPGYAVFGLGKLGGQALGYASDLELLLVYRGDGRTAGGKRDGITHVEFFDQWAKETASFLRTKREGIFEVDPRLRPYGTNGPLAVSLEMFRKYYVEEASSREAGAREFERLALVRLRWVAGDAGLGHELERLRDQAVYEGPPVDLEALWEVWDKGKAQKLAAEPGRANAKFGDGALVDLESAVQLLQVEWARGGDDGRGGVPQLRTPRLSEALEGLRRAGVLSAAEYAQLGGAYNFLRRLINALRMLRGNAKDLFLPPPGSDEAKHVAAADATRGGRVAGGGGPVI